MIYIIIYILIGIIFSLFGAIANDINRKVEDIKTSNNIDSNKSNSYLFHFKLFLFSFISRLFVIIFYPIIFIIKKSSSNNDKHFNFPEVHDDGLLYFRIMGGVCTVICNTCDHSESVLVNTHGAPGVYIITKGYQCQYCGKFHEIVTSKDSPKHSYMCECGGQLNLDKYIFCPNCKSTDVRYEHLYNT